MRQVFALVVALLAAVTVLTGVEPNELHEVAAKRLNAVEVLLERSGLVVTLVGDGVLAPSSIYEAEHWPPRLLIDLPGVTALVPTSTLVDIDPVERVRVEAHGDDSVVTRVVLDLSGPTSYHIEGVETPERSLRIIFPLPGSGASLVGQTPEWRRPEDGYTQRVSWLRARSLGDLRLDVDLTFAVVRQERPLVEILAFDAAIRAPMMDDVPLSHTFLAVGEVLGAEPVPVRRLDIRSPLALAVVRQERPLVEIVAFDEVARVSEYAGPFADHIALAHGIVELGRRLEPEAVPVPVSALTSSRFIRLGRTSPRPQAQLQQATVGGQRQYTGDPVSMDFQNADLRAVLRTFAEISELNIVIDPQVDGTVDVSLTDVPWDQALDIILRANQLGYDVDGTVVRIAPLVVLSAEAAQRRELAEEQALSGDLVVLTRTLSYARAANMADLVTPLLSQRGQVQTDERTNTMIITDLQDRLGAAEQLLDTLDRPEPQVEIEARIVQAGQDFARSLGVQWGITGRVAPDLGNTTPLTFPNRGGVSGRLGTQGPQSSGGDGRAGDTENSGTVVNLPAASPTAALGLTLGSVDGSLNLDVVLSAAENDGQVKLLSHPRVTTQNNVQAEIVQGDQIPIQVVANNTVTVTFEDAALSLRVTPQITAADTVIRRVDSGTGADDRLVWMGLW